jgi:hypothetical protein
MVTFAEIVPAPKPPLAAWAAVIVALPGPMIVTLPSLSPTVTI